MARTVGQLFAQFVGKPAFWHVTKGVSVRVKVNDARSNFGRELLLIEPADGKGSTWVRTESVTVIEDGNAPDADEQAEAGRAAGTEATGATQKPLA